MKRGGQWVSLRSSWFVDLGVEKGGKMGNENGKGKGDFPGGKMGMPEWGGDAGSGPDVFERKIGACRP